MGLLILSIKKFFKSFLSLMGYMFYFIFPQKLSRWFEVLYHIIYTSWKKHCFKSFHGIMEVEVKVSGGSFIEVGYNTLIGKRVEFQAITKFNEQTFAPRIVIGNNCQVMHDVQISSTNKVLIGNNVGIAARSLITDSVHGNFNMKSFEYSDGSEIPDVFTKNVFTRELYSKGPVIIEDDVHIAMNCIILPGVTIGHNSVISANTVVDKNIPPYSIVSGNPCRVISF